MPLMCEWSMVAKPWQAAAAKRLLAYGNWKAFFLPIKEQRGNSVGVGVSVRTLDPPSTHHHHHPTEIPLLGGGAKMTPPFF